MAKRFQWKSYPRDSKGRLKESSCEDLFEDLMEYWEINPFAEQFRGDAKKLKDTAFQRHDALSSPKFKGKISHKFLNNVIQAGFSRAKDTRYVNRVRDKAVTAWKENPIIERWRDGQKITIGIITIDYLRNGKRIRYQAFRDVKTGRFVKKPRDFNVQPTTDITTEQKGPRV